MMESTVWRITKRHCSTQHTAPNKSLLLFQALGGMGQDQKALCKDWVNS